MTQITSGVRAVLSKPWAYDAFQVLMGAHAGRRDLSQNVIKATIGSRILDLGCGTAKILDYLPDEVDYWGYDISAEYIASAQGNFGHRGNFFCGLVDESELANMPSFDIVLAIGVLHHMDDAAALQLFRLAKLALAPAGRFVSIDPVITSWQNPIARLLISQDRGQHVRGAEEYAHLAKREFALVDGIVRHRAWIPYTHWTMECSA